MDYLPHPKTRKNMVRVPLLLESLPYDGLGFDDYPVRCGWDVAKLVKGDLEGKPLIAAGSFIQQWLYFGLMATLLTAAGQSYRLSEFVVTHNDAPVSLPAGVKGRKQQRFDLDALRNKLDSTCSLTDVHQLNGGIGVFPLYVTGIPLVTGLAALKTSSMTATDEERQSKQRKLTHIFTKASTIMRILMSTMSAQNLATGESGQGNILLSLLPGSIEISITLLLETMKYHIVMIYGGQTRLGLKPLPSEWLIENMVAMGWCRAFLSDLLHRSGLHYVYYGYVLGVVPAANLDHALCDGRKCQANNIDKRIYATKHQDPSLMSNPPWWMPGAFIIRRVSQAWCNKAIQPCHCQHVSPDMSKVTALLSSGKIPLISLRTPRLLDKTSSLVDVDLDVVHWEPGIHYTAISHVWSDGLGNPAANSLPLCQLIEIRNLLLMARADILEAQSWFPQGIKNILVSYFNSSQRLFFWMDTFCVPLSSPHRMNAIEKLPDCFKNASIVLARDSLLATWTASAPIEETLYVLSLSNWVRRMWTFLEAALASRVHLQLSDGHERLIHLPGDLERSHVESSVVATPNFEKSLLLFPLTIGHLRLGLGSDATLLKTVALALAQRTTSKTTDEAIAVALLLKLGVEDVLQVHGKDRWRALLPAIKHLFKPEVIFMRGPKMDCNGYGWAPATFLTLDNENELARLTEEGEAQMHRSSEDDNGFMVSFPGLSFGTIPKPLTQVFCFESNADSRRYWATTGFKSSELLPWGAVEDPVGAGYCMVMRKIPTATSGVRAVLLRDCTREHDIITGHWVCILEIGALMQESVLPPYITERSAWNMITSLPAYREKCWFPDVQEIFPMQTWRIL